MQQSSTRFEPYTVRRNVVLPQQEGPIQMTRGAGEDISITLLYRILLVNSQNLQQRTARAMHGRGNVDSGDKTGREAGGKTLHHHRERMWTKVAGALGASAVGMGAIGAHALPPDLAASYVHGFHGFIDCNHGHTN